jgi:hypothetical protein
LQLNDSVFGEPLNALHLVFVEVEFLLNGLVNRELALFEQPHSVVLLQREHLVLRRVLLNLLEERRLRLTEGLSELITFEAQL